MTSPAPATHDAISAVSTWVLRVGVVMSSLVMVLGIALSFSRGHISVQRIESDKFDYRPSVIWDGMVRGEGKAVIEAGIYLLLFTPIMRVFASFLLFAFYDRDVVYAIITILVFILTLTGLIWLG